MIKESQRQRLFLPAEQPGQSESMPCMLRGSDWQAYQLWDLVRIGLTDAGLSLQLPEEGR